MNSPKFSPVMKTIVENSGLPTSPTYSVHIFEMVAFCVKVTPCRWSGFAIQKNIYASQAYARDKANNIICESVYIQGYFSKCKELPSVHRVRTLGIQKELKEPRKH